MRETEDVPDHVAMCDAGTTACLTDCKGTFSWELPPHCLPRCKRERLRCYARRAVPEGKR